jgi:hypothetical protein
LGGANLIGVCSTGEKMKALAGLRVPRFHNYQVGGCTPGCGVKTGSRLLSPLPCPAPLAQVVFATCCGFWPFIQKIAQLWG